MFEKVTDPRCPHCNQQSFALEHPLIVTKNFYVVCDVHPLIEGHILIIPKWHISCVGEFSDELFVEFKELYERFTSFIRATYGKVSTFEHGKIGQTVYHAHVHVLPFAGNPETIVPERKSRLKEINNLEDIRSEYRRAGRYLYFSIGDIMWLVDTGLGEPRFFRDRFARALGSAERGDWKEMQKDQHLMSITKTEIEALKNKLSRYNAKK